MNFSEPTVCEENSVSFARYTKTESGAAFFFPYSKNNTTLSTGEYFVIKYRVTKDATTQTAWSIYAGTETMKALDANDSVVSDTPFYADCEWHIAVIKLDNTKGNYRFNEELVVKTLESFFEFSPASIDKNFLDKFVYQ